MVTGPHCSRKRGLIYDTCKWILAFTLLVNTLHVNAGSFPTLPLKVGYIHNVGHDRYRRSDQFQSQRNNLKGKPGQGYYVEMEIGTPPQKVSMQDYLDYCHSSFKSVNNYRFDFVFWYLLIKQLAILLKSMAQLCLIYTRIVIHVQVIWYKKCGVVRSKLH